MAKASPKRKPARPKPMSPKAGLTKNRYDKGGNVTKKKS